MTKPFISRLKEYFAKVGEVLRGEAEAASVFANTTDIGVTREHVYFTFLKNHLPYKCNIFLGGFLFDDDGNESKQLDVIITTDTAPRFDLGGDKSFSPVEGTIGVASIKSTLNKSELFDALDGIASIPATMPIGARINPLMNHTVNYEDWPLKVVYGSNGIAVETIMAHLNEYYSLHQGVPVSRRPNFIHVAGKYIIYRAIDGIQMIDNAGNITALQTGQFYPFTESPDVLAIVQTLNRLQELATISTHILFSYTALFDKVATA